MMKLFLPVLLSGLSFGAAAQSGGPDEGPADGQPPRWGIGVAVAINDSEFAGEGTRVIPLPLVSYGGSSLVPTLVALGMLMAFAKAEPGARRAIRRRSTAQALRRR